MRTFLIALLLFAICDLKSVAARPNILVILVDDMGYSDLGCYGSEIRTPNLDALAKNGIRYTQMYNTSKCYPTRASLMTGVYFQRTDRGFAGTATAGEVLKPAGYRTLWSGKHHGDFNPMTRGFDRFDGFLGGAINFWHPGKTPREGEKEPQRITHYRWVVDGREVPEFIPPKGWHATDGFTDRALEWLEEDPSTGSHSSPNLGARPSESRTGQARPFFLYVAYNAPHWPLHARPEDIAKYDGVYDRGYDAIRRARYERQLATGLFDKETAPLPDDPLAENWARLSPDEKQREADRMEIHAAMVEQVDRNVGHLLESLRKSNGLDSTVIFFLADNGASPERTSRANLGDSSGPMGSMNSYECIGRNWSHACNTPMRLYKATSHEGGINTPMIVSWPAGLKKTGTICREPCHLIDLLPTWMELAGATYPGASQEQNIPSLDGVSLTPTFRGQPLARSKPLCFQFGGGKAIRDGQWKLVRAGSKDWELYDFSSNRNETVDVADRYPERVATLSKRWAEWHKECTGREFVEKKKAPRDKARKKRNAQR